VARCRGASGASRGEETEDRSTQQRNAVIRGLRVRYTAFRAEDEEEEEEEEET